MMQKCGKERLKVGLFTLFLCLGIFVQAQTRIVNELDIDNEHDINNDNRWYFHDIALERGLYTATQSNGNMSDGRITSFYGSYFLTHNLGIRSGISLITDLTNNSPYVKIPCLFAIRSRTFHILTPKAESFGEFLGNLFLAIIPSRYEINLGPSFGYVWNNQRNFASSIDLNFRMGFQIWRIGINGNMGINYLWTKNFVDKEFVMVNRQFRHAWFANLSLGVLFRF
jgi:hypothetical protein